MKSTAMGNKIVTEADRKATPVPLPQRRDPAHSRPWPAHPAPGAWHRRPFKKNPASVTANQSLRLRQGMRLNEQSGTPASPVLVAVSAERSANWHRV